jgi:hypothetical protein
MSFHDVYILESVANSKHSRRRTRTIESFNKEQTPGRKEKVCWRDGVLEWDYGNPIAP